MKKKKPKPPKIHILHPVMLKMQKKQEKGRDGRVQSWVIGDSTIPDTELTYVDTEWETLERSGVEDVDSGLVGEVLTSANDSARRGRDLISDVMSIGDEALDVVAEHAIKNDNSENGIADKSSLAGW